MSDVDFDPGPVPDAYETSVVPALHDPEQCPHPGAYVEAYLDPPDDEDPKKQGLPWRVLAPEQRDLDGIRAGVALGVCPDCASRVVSIRTWDAENWTPEHGPAWTSRWTRLIRDGDRWPRERND